MKIALLQTDITWNSPSKNISKAAKLCADAASKGAEMVLLPEMFTCGFSMPTGEFAKENFEIGSSFLVNTARELNVTTVGTVPEADKSGALYNSALLCRPDQSIESYRKLHLFSYGEETTHYSAGSRLLTTSVGDLRCSVFICYDLRFPLPFYQVSPQTDLFIIPANWPSTRREHWITLLRARAIESQAYVAGINRVGQGGGLSYSGDSVVFAPDGSQLTRTSGEEEVIVCDIESERVSTWRATFPALRDRRPDLYSNFSSI
jgi:predicted amidohydrolase